MPTIHRQKVVSNGVTFNDSLVLPSGAQVWGVDIMDGWKSTGDPTEFSVELGSYRDGSAAASFFPVRKRYVTIGGYVVAPSAAAAELLEDVLVRDAFPRNKRFQIVRHEAVPKFVECRRSAAVERDWAAVPNGFRWQTTVMCEDPFKYGLASQFGSTGVTGSSVTGHSFPVTFPMSFTGTTSVVGGITFVNTGTAPSSHFTATISGLLNKGAWRLANETTGSSIGFNVAVGVGDQLVIDFRNQVATFNGAPLSASYTGAFWQLVPGSNTIQLYAEYDPNASATITGYSAWE